MEFRRRDHLCKTIGEMGILPCTNANRSVLEEKCFMGWEKPLKGAVVYSLLSTSLETFWIAGNVKEIRMSTWSRDAVSPGESAATAERLAFYPSVREQPNPKSSVDIYVE